MMSAADRVQAGTSRYVFWLGVAIFLASLAIGVLRSLTRDHSMPAVGVEYSSELQRAFAKKGYEQTLPWMRAAVVIDLDNETTARELLAAARQAGDLQTAVSTLERLVRLRPDDAELRMELVSGLLGEGRAVEALAHGQVALRLNPNSSVAYGNLGAALLGLEHHSEAAAAYRRALQLDPANENAQRALEFPLRGY